MSRSGREALPDVREAHLDVREWSGVSLGYLGVVGRLPRMSESGRDALQNVRMWWKALTESREWSGGPPECPEVVGGPSGYTGGPPGWPGVVGRLCRMSENG